MMQSGPEQLTSLVETARSMLASDNLMVRLTGRQVAVQAVTLQRHLTLDEDPPIPAELVDLVIPHEPPSLPALGNDSAQRRELNPAMERLSREELDRLSLRRFRRVLEYVASVPFYRHRLRQAGVEPEDITSLDDIRRVPLVRKAELIRDQEDHPPYGTRLAVDPEQIAILAFTSGTTGHGQELYAWTRRDVAFACGVGAYSLAWAGLPPSARYVGFLAGRNSVGGRLTPAVAESLFGRQPYYLSGLSFEQQLEWMHHYGADIMFGNPSYVSALTVAAQQAGYPSLGTRAILVTAEPYPLAWALAMQQHWKVQLAEIYGSTQTHGVAAAATCEQGPAPDGRRGMMHVFEWAGHLEVIDPATGHPCRPGETGEVVYTTFAREASPLVRFATGDRATVVDHRGCRCGRALHAIECGTVARYDDMIKIKTQNVWPDAVDSAVFSHPEVDEYQARVFLDEKARERCEIRLAVKPGEAASDVLPATLTRELKERTNVTFAIHIVPRAELPTFDYKARRWIDERPADLAKLASSQEELEAT